MESKYVKIALLFMLASFALVSIVFGVIVLVVRGPSFFQHPAAARACSQAAASSAAYGLIANSSTFSFDGIAGSIKQVNADSPDNGLTWRLSYVFQTAHPGHGNRSGQTLAQVITDHSALIDVSGCKIASAICDGSWDLLSDKPAPSR